ARFEAECRRSTSAPAIIAAARVRIEGLEAEIIRLRELRGERGLRAEERAELVQLRRELGAARRRIEDAERFPLCEEQCERLEGRHRVQAQREIGPLDALDAMLGPRLTNGSKWERASRRQAAAESIATSEAE